MILQAAAVRILLEAGADVTATDKAGNTPLHGAILGWEAREAQSYVDCTQALLAAGANPAALNKLGQSANSLCSIRGITLKAPTRQADERQQIQETHYPGEASAPTCLGNLVPGGGLLYCLHVGSTCARQSTLRCRGGAARVSQPCWLFYSTPDLLCCRRQCAPAPASNGCCPHTRAVWPCPSRACACCASEPCGPRYGGQVECQTQASFCLSC